jgi:hypothetical protein
VGSPGVVARITGTALLALLVVGCGNRTLPAAAPVKLTVESPTDGARQVADSATITGVVAPHHARVLVLGHSVSADRSGHFTASVPLVPGTNLIDVIASAPRAQPAMLSLRVTRYVLINVPDVTGRSPNDAVARIRAAGLTPVLHADSNPLSFLLPFSTQVCNQSPSGGSRVEPDTRVTLNAGKVCV